MNIDRFRGKINSTGGSVWILSGRKWHTSFCCDGVNSITYSSGERRIRKWNVRRVCISAASAGRNRDFKCVAGCGCSIDARKARRAWEGTRVCGAIEWIACEVAWTRSWRIFVGQQGTWRAENGVQGKRREMWGKRRASWENNVQKTTWGKRCEENKVKQTTCNLSVNFFVFFFVFRFYLGHWTSSYVIWKKLMVAELDRKKVRFLFK